MAIVDPEVIRSSVTIRWSSGGHSHWTIARAPLAIGAKLARDRVCVRLRQHRTARGGANLPQSAAKHRVSVAVPTVIPAHDPTQPPPSAAIRYVNRAYPAGVAGELVRSEREGGAAGHHAGKRWVPRPEHVEEAAHLRMQGLEAARDLSRSTSRGQAHAALRLKNLRQPGAWRHSPCSGRACHRGRGRRRS